MFQKEQWYVVDCCRPSQTSVSIKICRGRRQVLLSRSPRSFVADRRRRSVECSHMICNDRRRSPTACRRPCRSLEIIWEPGFSCSKFKQYSAAQRNATQQPRQRNKTKQKKRNVTNRNASQQHNQLFSLYGINCNITSKNGFNRFKRITLENHALLQCTHIH